MSTAPTRTKAQDAYRLIKQGLLSGVFTPGERLVEAKVCKSLGLRRGPVREALLLLNGEGLIKNEGAYKGHAVEYIEDIPSDQLLYRYELREQIAGGACRLAAKSMNGWQIDTLRELAERIDINVDTADREATYQANLAFHDFLIKNCGNPLLGEVWKTHHLMPSRPRTRELDDEIRAQVPDSDHPSIADVVEAIARHDQAEAEARMKTRVRKVTEILRKTVHRSSMGGRDNQ